MGNQITEVVEGLPSAQFFKIHARMCSKLLKFVMKISEIFPELEAARPRCTSGIEALCSLNNGIAKAESLLRSCRESSVLYLALTANEILSRCKKSQDLLEQSLSQIQHMVPVVLATKISGVLADLRSAAFCLDPPEEEAQRVLRELLYSNCSTSVDPTMDSALTASVIQTASSYLHIASKKALLIEERSIRNLLEKSGKDQKVKRKILLFFLHLLSEYEKSLHEEQNDSVPCVELDLEEYTSKEARIDLSSRFDAGNKTSSVSDRKLVDSSFTLNSTCMDNRSSTHVSTLNPELQEMLLTSSESDSLNSTVSLSSSTATDDLNLRLDFSNVSFESGALPWDSRCKEVEDIICFLEHNDKSWPGIPSKVFVELIVRFLEDACGLCDVEAQKSGCLLLFEFVQKHQNCVSRFLTKDAYDLLATFLCTSVSKQSLLILEALSFDEHCHYNIATSGVLSCILDILDGQIQEFLEPSLTILRNLSTNGACISSFIVPSKVIPKLVPLFDNATLASYCIVILRNMLDNKDVIRSVAENEDCVASITKLLVKSDHDDQQRDDVVEFLQMLKVEIDGARKGPGADIDVGLTKHHNVGFFQRFISKCFSS